MATYSQEITQILLQAGCEKAFGVSGGYIFPLWKSIASSDIAVYHFRHETGAVFAAMEASLYTDKITIAFATSGPGISNSVSGLQSARAGGARLVFLSAITAEDSKGPYRVQETTPAMVDRLVGKQINYPLSHSIIVRNADDLLKMRSLLLELSENPSGFVLGIFLALDVQESPVLFKSQEVMPSILPHHGLAAVEDYTYLSKQAQALSERLRIGKWLLWIGYGTRRASKLVCQLREEYGMPVICTPRAKGIFPENHDMFLGVSGLGSTISSQTVDGIYDGALVLGTRLGELSSLHMQMKWSKTKLVCVNLSRSEVYRNVPSDSTIIEANIDKFLDMMVTSRPSKRCKELPLPLIPRIQAKDPFLVHPVTVMSVVQSMAINKHSCCVLADVGNSLCWATHYLKFTQPRQYRLSLDIAAMGHGSCGAVGVGLSGTTAVAIVGDGAMLMQSEVSSAVQYQSSVIWLVMNDSRYNMCHQILSTDDNTPPCCDITSVDFAQYAQALGCKGYTATSGNELEELLEKALSRQGPTMIDVKIDRIAKAPSGGRSDSLKTMSSK
ncbi:hypothetical protein FSHL1_010182 [Fusarium sambucinum]